MMIVNSSHLSIAFATQRNDLVAALEQINKDNVQLNDEYAEVELYAESASEEVNLIMNECRELEKEIDRNNKLQSASREEAATLKKLMNDLKDEYETSKWTLQEAEAEEENLRMQVVTSPDRRKANVQNSKRQLEKQKAANAKLDAQLQDAKLRIGRFEHANKEFELVELQLADLLDQMNKYKEIVSDLEAALERVKANEKETLAILGETDEAKHEHKRMEEKIVSQRKQHKLQIDAAQEALETVKASLLIVEKDRREALSRREGSEAEIRKIEASMEKLQAKTEAEIQMKISDYKEFERAYLERQKKRLALLGITYP
jgi:chromosome segregation ATPase